MELFWICLATLLASLLTFFSGFGLGTVLMPVAAVFLPVPVAIALTASVHFMSKLLKLVLLWRHVDTKSVLRFGIPALVTAVPGALLLDYLSTQPALAGYTLAGHVHEILWVKLIAGMLLISFAAAEQSSQLKLLTRSKYALPFGGALSGFFGGLSGHQGAFRSAFLVQADFSEKAFVATNAAIAALVDAVRLFVYGATLDIMLFRQQLSLLTCAVLASFLGVWLGTVWLEKVTLRFMQQLVAVMLYVLGAALIAGLI